jgi:hypothetical protein
MANVRAAVPAIEASHSDNTGTGASAGYAGMTKSSLISYDAGLNVTGLTVPTATSASYCVQSVVGPKTWSKNGPGAVIATGPCP